MKTIFLFIFICHFLAPGTPQTAWLITETTRHTTVHTITDIAQADSITGIDCEKLLQNSNFFEIRTRQKTIYCEKKQIKITKSGKQKLKKIRHVEK